MGKFQPAKVNPEVKQYYVLNNFSGGINTNSSDEVMQDYEFRALINVDLAKQGRIEKRKGWGHNNIINMMIDAYTDTDVLSFLTDYEDRRFVYAELIHDKYGTISSYREDEDLPEQYDVRLLIFYMDKTIIFGDNELYRIVIREVDLTNNGNSAGSVLANIDIVASTLDTFIKVKQPIKIIRHLDRFYFNTRDLHAVYPGLAYYDANERKLVEISSQTTDSYRPIPQEIVNVGFNLLDTTPLDHIDSLEGYNAGIYAIFFTNEDNTEVYDAIPSNKPFVINILTTGTFTKTIMDACFDETAFAYSVIGEPEGSDNLQPIGYTFTYLEDVGGVYRYKINFTETLSSTRLIYVKLETSSEIAIKSYANKTAIETEFAWVNKGVAGEAFLLDNGAAYLKSNTAISYLGQVTTISGSPPSGVAGWYRTPGVDSIYYYDGGSVYEPSYDLIEESTGDYVFNSVVVPVMGGLYYDEETPEMWEFNMSAGSLLLVISTTTMLYSFISSYFARPFIDTPKITSLVSDADNFFGKANMTKAGNRLLLYGDNAIFWSDYSNFSYFPNPNYTLLSLDSDDVITNISYFRGSYLVFTKKTIWRISGEFGDIDSFAIVLINDAIGCVAPKSVRSFENTVVFMSNDGLYRVKQAYYTGGLENVEKIDTHVKELVVVDKDAESIMFNEQYWLFSDIWGDYDAIRYYYSIVVPNGHPFVVDEYGSSELNKPDAVFVLGNKLFSIKGKTFYQYGIDYYDFLPDAVENTEQELTNATYITTIVTSNNSFGYSTHTKKMKSIYIKTDAKEAIPFYISIALDNETDATLTAADMVPMLDPTTGAIDYVEVSEANLNLIGQTMDPTAVLDYFIMNEDILNSNPTQLVKLPFSGKGRNVKVMIKQKSPAYFAIENIGFLFKLGKVRENRR